jgi:alkylation response protein AidB-like acyl-CoA dehydrogenase
MTTAPYGLDEDLLQLRDSLRAMFSRCPGAAQVRLASSSEDFDPALWKILTLELELPGIAIPEQFDGSGSSFAPLSVVLGEMGRVLYSGPYFSTAVLGAQALLASGDQEAKAEFLPRMVRAERVAAVAGLVDGDDGRVKTADDLTGRRSPDGWVLEGRTTYVVDGDSADLLVVLARVGSGSRCFLVDGEASGVMRSRLSSMDLTRSLAEIRFDAVAARPLGGADAGAAVLERLGRVAPLALAAEQVGASQHCLETAVAYAQQRHQFGRPIGSFQAVKHQLANAYVDVDAAACAVIGAVSDLDTGSSDAMKAIHVAKAAASDAFYRAACAQIQTLGGIGYTWEHPAHLYLRRAVTSRALFGSPSQHRRALLTSTEPR